MKRDPALQPLSRDHHQALFAAQRLRRADSATAPDARAAFLAFWREHGNAHFRAEEEILLPAFAGHGDPHHPLVQRVLSEHVAIRHVAARLEAQELGVDALQRLGQSLSDHVRLEERQLFPLIEEAMPADDLKHLAAALAEGESQERA